MVASAAAAAVATVDVAQLFKALDPLIRKVHKLGRDVAIAPPPPHKTTPHHEVAVCLLQRVVIDRSMQLLVEDVNSVLTGRPNKSSTETLNGCLTAKFGPAGEAFRVTRKLGSGFYGSVYAIGDDLCAKIERLRIESVAGGRVPTNPRTLKARLRTVHEISARAGEMGIGPRVVDAFTCLPKHSGAYYVIVMERLRGESLADWLDAQEGGAAGGAVAKNRSVASMMKRVDAMLAKLHAAGIHHNDVHAGNIMVVDGKPRLIDFGMATMNEPRTFDAGEMENMKDIELHNTDHYDRAVCEHVIHEALSKKRLRILA